jgi:hypothetical protein
MTVKWIEATVHRLRRAASARAFLPLALVGLLLAPMLGQAMPHASAATPRWRSVVMFDASGTDLAPMLLLSNSYHTAAPVTVAWKVASADAVGIRSHFAVTLLDAQGRTRARLADTTRPGRASSTIVLPACISGCTLRVSVANMNYAVVGYALAPPR